MELTSSKPQCVCANIDECKCNSVDVFPIVLGQNWSSMAQKSLIHQPLNKKHYTCWQDALTDVCFCMRFVGTETKHITMHNWA